MKKLIFMNEEEMNDYYDVETNTYRFYDKDGLSCDVVLKFDLETNARISCHNLDCIDINVEGISAWDIEACNITSFTIIAHDIDATSIKAEEIILINNGSISVMGSIRCPSILCERLTNW